MFDFKKCCCCCIKKTFEFFGNCKTTKDGLYPQCKSCVSENNKKIRLKRKKEILLNGFVQIKEKICIQCKEIKTIEQFYKRSDSKDGYDIYCKICEKTNVKNRIEQRHTKLVNSSINFKVQKICICCNVEKNNIDFYNSKRSLDGLSVYCKICNRNKTLLKKYQIDIDTFGKMYEEKSGTCDICKRFFNKEKICIDHNHSTGQVRGLLCKLCNTSLGAMKENVDFIQNMIDYIILWQNK